MWGERTGVKVTVAESRSPLAAPVAATAIDLLAGDFAPAPDRRSRRFACRASPGDSPPRSSSCSSASRALDWWRLERERRTLEAERESIFRAAFPEAKTVVDPALQMRRNLADLQRARGRASANDFLALATAAAKNDPAPARRLTYSGGRLEIDRGSAAK